VKGSTIAKTLIFPAASSLRESLPTTPSRFNPIGISSKNESNLGKNTSASPLIREYKAPPWYKNNTRADSKIAEGWDDQRSTSFTTLEPDLNFKDFRRT